MIDTLPLWFWLPLSIVLWSAVAVIYVRARRAERAERERIEAWARAVLEEFDPR